jgi:hypothetical protein
MVAVVLCSMASIDSSLVAASKLGGLEVIHVDMPSLCPVSSVWECMMEHHVSHEL